MGLKVLLWKGFLIRKKHPFILALEILIPALLFFIIGYVANELINIESKDYGTTFNSPNSLDEFYGERKIYYYPNTSYFEDIMIKIQIKMQLPYDKIKGYSDIDDLWNDFEYETQDNLAILFSKNSTKIEYTIRYNDNYYQSKNNKLFRDINLFEPGMGSNYLWNGFIGIQKLIDIAFIEYEMGNRSMPRIVFDLLEFPYPFNIKNNKIYYSIINYLPLVILIGFIPSSLSLLGNLIEEKNSGIREFLKLNRINKFINWINWIIYSLIPLIFSILIIVLLLIYSIPNLTLSVINYSSVTVIYFFILSYCMAIIAQTLFLSSIFKNVSLSYLISILINLLSYLVSDLVLENDVVNIISPIFPNTILSLGFKEIANYELIKDWNSFNFIYFIGLMLSNFVFYTVIGLYIDAINPGKYGTPKHMFFPFHYLISIFKTNNTKIGETELLNLVDNRKLEKCIELKNLYKIYNNKAVIDNLSMDIYKNQITVLLGNNGAGKSTLLGLITGIIKKSHGEIYINEKKINSNFIKNIGLCSQHNLFFPELTTYEHLLFFGMLTDNVKKNVEINNLLTLLDLLNEKNTLPHRLSGGMKRKLSLAIAIISGSEIIILDEPSTGMDIDARKNMWEILLALKKEKTIIITTHYMDEVDILGDNIAIIDSGKLISYGSPQFLKSHYKTGLNLRITLKKSNNKTKEDIRNILSPSSFTITGNEINTTIMNTNYAKVFKKLGEIPEIDNLSFLNNGIEDIFNKSKSYFKKRINAEKINYKYKKDFILQLKALVYKHLYFIKHNIRNYILLLFLIIQFTTFATFLSQTREKNSNESLELNLGIYDKTLILQNFNNCTKNISYYYNQQIIKQNHEYKQVENVLEAIIQLSGNNILYYGNKMIIASEIITNSYNETKIVILYNNLAIHSAPISFNLISNSIAKSLLGKDYSINITSYPYYTDTKTIPLSVINIELIWALLIPLGPLFFLGLSIYFPHIELSSGISHIQFMSGVNDITFWLITYFLDIVIYFIFSLVLSFTIILFSPFAKSLEVILLIFLLYSLSGIPFAYLFSRAKIFSKGYARFILVNFVIGIVLTCIIIILQEEFIEKYKDFVIILKKIGYIFLPQFGLVHLCLTYSKKAIEKYNDGEDLKYSDIMQFDFIFFIIGAIIYITLNILLNNYGIRKFLNFKRKTLYDTSFMLKERYFNIFNLNKSYRKKQVIRDLTLNIDQGKFVGLLGINGAGKSSTFKLITRELVKDSGIIKISNNKKDSYLRSIGYCPQIDSFNYCLTGYENLKIMAMLRGINDNDVVKSFLELFNLKENIKSRYYSGGNKRKLSLAMALIGLPDIILLDEPTNGIDTITRTEIWSLINDIAKNNSISFLLSSHNMEECERLCDEIKIMKQGKICTEYEICQIKKENLNIIIKTNNNNTNYIKTFLKNYIKNITLLRQSSNLLFYRINLQNIKLYSIFYTLENLKKFNYLEDFFVNESIMMDTFI